MYLIVRACQVISRFSGPFSGISRCPVALSQSSVPAFRGPWAAGSTARPALPDPRALIDAMLVPGLDAKALYAC